MQEKPAKTRLSGVTSAVLHVRYRPYWVVGLALLCSVVLPVVAIFLGVFLIAAAALHAWSPNLRPYVQPILRVPVARPGKRHARLLLAAGAGALLVVSGSAGAAVRGQMRSRWEERAARREAEDKRALELLERARDQLAAGNVQGAELVLLDADAIVDIDAARRAEVDELGERMRRSRDPKAILDVLARLPQEEFEAFEKGERVPEALEFPEPALTFLAVEIALDQIDEAQKVRARP